MLFELESLLSAALFDLMLKPMSNTLSTTETKRRWLQFSMRTVIAVVTLLCVALSLWVVPAERRRRAVAAVEVLGGTVTFVDSQTTNESSPIAFLRRWLPQAYFDEAESVNLFLDDATDADLAHFQGLTSLQGLELTGTQVTDAGLAHLQGMTSLKRLSLQSTQITDAGLAHLRGLTGLRTLSLNNTQITDAGLAHLQGLTSLRWLSITNTPVTDAGLDNFNGLTGLQVLSLSYTQVIGDRPQRA